MTKFYIENFLFYSSINLTFSYVDFGGLKIAFKLSISAVTKKNNNNNNNYEL